jgi:FtsP/CotA-like multicopper oxidase with cupredoxin domain
MLRRFQQLLALAASLFLGFATQAEAQTPAKAPAEAPGQNRTMAPTAGGNKSLIVERATRRGQLNAARAAAAARQQAALKAKGGVIDPKILGVNPAANTIANLAAAAKAKTGSPQGVLVPGPGFQLAQPDYMFGTASNWHNTKPIHKFVDTLPGLTAANKNNLGNFIPVAVADTTTYPGSDYYQIGVVEYTQKVHSELNPTKFRGYKDLSASAENTANGANSSNYLGPVIIATKDRPVRVKMTNMLPFGPVNPTTGRRPGDLFLPVDTTLMGAGIGLNGGTETFTENRAEFHLHGGLTPWISDGTPHQWVTPAGETTSYPKGAVFQNVPDMAAGATPTDGTATYFWSNQQSGRLMFYHDHAFGLTRLNVYAGEAAGYLITSPTDEKLINAGILPNNGGGVYRYGIPLIIQDKTFVDTTTLGTVGVAGGTDPTWDVNAYGGDGALWFPHVYMPNQNPADITGACPMGRWDYGPWFWPPVTAAAGLQHGAEPVLGDPNGTMYPGTPNPSLTPEFFADTPMVNGTPYPTTTVDPTAYRFRVLNASNDRFWNLSWFVADATGVDVAMVPAAPPAPTNLTWPAKWPTDGRAGGVPDPLTAGPSWIQIGNESGFLATPAVLPPQPVTYEMNRRNIVVLNVVDRGLWLGPAERADVIVDFSAFAGKTLILYNDSPAPVPAFDSRLDYYTGDPDQTTSGGAATTLPGFGPNTRTVMQVKVNAGSNPAYNMAALNAAFVTTATAQGAFIEDQHLPIIPQIAYNSALNRNVTKDLYARIQDFSFNPTAVAPALPGYVSTENGTQVNPSFLNKAIQELFELDYGRMNATLGVEVPGTNFNIQTTIPLGYRDPITEILNDGETQFWKITHNGVDTHPVHFHLYDVQIVNRVGWDGAVTLPWPSEIGWKETVKMNPLEDIIVAFRPLSMRLPFAIPNSMRSMDVLQPANVTVSATDPATGNQAAGYSNALQDFGWEYVWHCHILGHEENDFMRPEKLIVATTVPAAPTVLTVNNTAVSSRADLAWTDNATNEVGFEIQRRVSGSAAPFVTVGKAVPNVWTYSDFTIIPGTAYDYQVIAWNQAGNSLPSNIATLGAVATVSVSGSVYTFNGVNVPLPGVTISFSGGPAPVVTDAAGNYTAAVPLGWTGTITPSSTLYAFNPVNIAVLTGLTANLTGQNFLAHNATLTISGTIVGAPAATPVTVTAFDGVNTVTATPVAGAYTLTVPNPYTGTVTATGAGLVFTPANYTYTAIAANQVAQNFTAQVQITGTVTLNGAALAGVSMNYTGGTVLTNAAGQYTINLTPGWTGTVTPFKTGYFFTPISTSYTLLNIGTVTNYTAVAGIEIAGQAYLPTVPITPMAGVTVSFLTGGTVNAGSVVTDASGFYYMFVPSGWSGTASAALTGYVFAPTNRNFTNVTTTQTGRNFVATAVVTYSGKVLSGAAPLAGVRVSFTNGNGTVSATTNATGDYTINLTSGWTGTITPTLRGYTFSPTSVRITTPVTANTTQNFNTTQTITGRTRVLATGAAVPGVTISLSTGGTVTSNATGNFTIVVPTGWTGTLTASGGGYTTWTPAAGFSYTNLITNVTGLRFNGQ